ncbi:hypothetical protein AT1G34049 [Arabidopsis thaliana]|uniref:Uncharacterized protein n=2 Tax=Arabidopsis thaliana TaxID=3702 RepID=A0A5S9WIM5_ARATH|nr:uncharacterized protein AT1G34049 [Arabidopsis thaliana]ANM59576.1 hypothetical protein AT1G34049 [Arabidopsis thaliana]CAA0265321.1 unnamed protein product [Arabidopsis thaliana]|eukprot:NP_001321922.1 hypothetical protein AT1G34049 [Arabidopsis thaliana]
MSSHGMEAKLRVINTSGSHQEDKQENGKADSVEF